MAGHLPSDYFKYSKQWPATHRLGVQVQVRTTLSIDRSMRISYPVITSHALF